MRILFLSPYIPSRVRIRPYSWIHALASLGHDVHLVALQPPEDAWASDAELRDICEGVDIVPLSRVRTVFNGLLTLPTANPLQLAYSQCPAAERQVADLWERGAYDVVHIEHLRGVALASRLHDAPSTWDAVDSISALFSETAALAPGRGQRWMARLDLARTRGFETRAPFLFDRMLVTSPCDADTFVGLAGVSARERVAVVPNGVDTCYFTPPASGSRDAVVFTGKLSYHANAATAQRLVQRVMPLVWAERPETPVVIAGKDPPAFVREFAADSRVTVTGYLDDLRPVFARAAVAACPLVYGAGIQNKVLEAMACGVPVVTTPAVASALLAAPEREIIVASSDSEFASAMCQLLDDARKRRNIGAAGRAYVEREHQWRRLAQRLTEVYAEAIKVSASRASHFRTSVPSPANVVRG